MRAVFTIASVLALTACSGLNTASQQGMSNNLADQVQVASVYQCGDTRVLARFTKDDVAWISTPTQAYTLPHVISASGAKYAAQVQGREVVFWSKGKDAFFEEGGPMRECKGVFDIFPLKAQGNEPGWMVTADKDATVFTGNYGEKTVTLPVATLVQKGNGYLYEAKDGAHHMQADIKLEVCTDNMSGMNYPMKARVTMDDKTFEGCAGSAKALLTGDAWKVVTIAGKKAIGDVTILWGDGGKLSGASGCNRYMSTYQLSGEGLTMGRPASTRMACPSDRMTQEARFLQLLAKVVQFDIDKKGQLVLTTSTDQKIVATR